jgi:hypothetical protein
MRATAVALKIATLRRVSPFFSALNVAQLPCMAIQPCTAQLTTFSAKVSALKSATFRCVSPFFSVLKTSIFFTRVTEISFP